MEIKTPEQIALMRQGGHKLAAILDRLLLAAQPGVTTLELDALAERWILESGGQPNFKLVPGYPYSVCTSVNEQVIHGFPNKRPLVSGDELTIDIGMLYQGWHLDHAKTIIVATDGAPKDAAVTRFLNVGRQAVERAIDLVRPGVHVGDLSHAMQHTVESAGYSVIREFTGHGVGSELHMEPMIPCFGREGSGPTLQEGAVVAIEVMLNMGGPAVRTLKDGWTVVTKDKSLSAQFEHTVAVTADGHEILTLPEEAA